MSQTLGGGDQDDGARRDGCERDGCERDGEQSSGLQGSSSSLDDACAGSRSRRGDACAGGDGGVASPFIMGYDQWVNGEEEEEDVREEE
jgi:hypothetical protein